MRAVVLPGLGAEAGAEGRAVAARIAARAAECDVAVVGPNCMGIATPGGVSLWLGTVAGTDAFVPGHVACVAHSGSIGEAFLACGPRVGFRTVVSAGSELSRDLADFVGFLAEDEGTRAIGLFVETIRRPDAFVAALAAAAEAGKPVVCLKVGRSQAAARAALAHSGAVVGSARAFSALLRHHGAIEVSDFHELLETLEVLGRRRWPRGLRIAAVSESGGECGLLADHGEEAGIPFAPFDDATAARLIEAFPNFTQPENPLDCWAIDAYEHVFPGTLSIMRETGSYDILLAQLDLSRHRGEHEEGWSAFITAALADAVEGTDVFGAVTSVHATDPPPAIAELARGRDVALLRGTREGLRAIASVARWCERPHVLPPVAHPPLPGEPLPAGALAEHDSCALLERYGLTFPPRVRCASPHEAASAFDLLGGPVVVKLDGPAHKQVAGGVALGISSAAEARDCRRAHGRTGARRPAGAGRRRGVLRPHARSRLRAGAGRGPGRAGDRGARPGRGGAGAAGARSRARARGRGAGARAARKPGRRRCARGRAGRALAPGRAIARRSKRWTSTR